MTRYTWSLDPNIDISSNVQIYKVAVIKWLGVNTVVDKHTSTTVSDDI